MSTLGEVSLLNILQKKNKNDDGILSGTESELANPLSDHGSANIPLLARAALDVEAFMVGNTAWLRESAILWENHLEPGKPGVLMRHEFGSAIYSPWIVCPIATIYYILSKFDFGQRAADRARKWLRAWTLVNTVPMGWTSGNLISDDDDPPGEYRAGPVYATSSVDKVPWMTRRNAGIRPSVMCGHRSVCRSHNGDDDYRLMRAYLDQSQAISLIMMLLGYDWTKDFSKTGDWVVQWYEGMKNRFGVNSVLPLTEEEIEKLKQFEQSRNPDLLSSLVIEWELDDWKPGTDFVIVKTTEGLWSRLAEGGHVSTADLYGCSWNSGGNTAFLFCDTGERDSKGNNYDGVGDGYSWEEGSHILCKRQDGRNGVRRIEKSLGEEEWRFEGGPNGYTVIKYGYSSPTTPTPPDPDIPNNEDQNGDNMPENGPNLEYASDGNPIRYHEITGSLLEIEPKLKSIIGKMRPEAAEFLAGWFKGLSEMIIKK